MIHIKRLSTLLLAAVVLSTTALCCNLLIVDHRQRVTQEEILRQLPAKIVASMTLEQKVGQLIHIGIPGKSLDAAARREIAELNVGGVILFAINIGSTNELKKLNADLQSAATATSGVPLFISADQEGGRVARVREATEEMPGAMALGMSEDRRLAHDSGFTTAYELRQLGINLILAPVLDVNNNPANPVINTRSFGSDPELVATMATAHEEGIRRAFSTGTIKHFPGHGDTNVDSHYDLPVISRSLEELRRIELVPFRRAIDNGAEMVMSAHILFTAIDPDHPATLSPKILRTILREELGFQGLTISDAMEMHAVAKRYRPEELARRAFEAGIDIILLTGERGLPQRMHAALLQSFEKGELNERDLDAAVERQIALKLRKGLFHEHSSPLLEQIAVAMSESELKALAARMEQESAAANGYYQRIRSYYRQNGGTLQRSIAEASITALGESFAGLSADELGRAQLWYRHRAIDDAWRTLHPTAAAPSHVGSPEALNRALNEDAVILFELEEGQLAAWNRFAQANARRIAENRVRLVVLYSGNPFLKLERPAGVVVLASYSRQGESLRALVRRATDGEPVRRAQLTLPE